MIDLSRFGTTRGRAYELRRQLDALNSAVMLADARQPDMPIVGVSRECVRQLERSALRKLKSQESVKAAFADYSEASSY